MLLTAVQIAVNPLRKNNVTVTGNLSAGKTLLFLHGFGTDQTAWQKIIPAFEATHRIILMDNMGAGQSAKDCFSKHRYLTLSGYAQDLIDVCQALELKDVVFVGHSAGGMIGVLAAIQRPEFFSRMILIGASPRYMNDDGYQGGFTKADIDAIYQAVTLGFAAWAAGFAAYAMGNPERPELAKHFAATIQDLDKNHALTALCAIFQSDHRQDAARLNKPTLLIQSQADMAVPLAVAEYLNQHIEASQLVVINATGHLPHISAPSEVIDAIQQFIDA